MICSYEVILNIIEDFYEKATNDFMIGYHFRNISDFDSHIPHIAEFWNLQINGKLHTPETRFDVINRHVPLNIKKGELNRWIILFNETLDSFQESNEQSAETILQWREKIDHFKNIFLNSKLLFSN